VPETYPIGAVVVSDSGYRSSGNRFERGGRESGFTADVVIRVLLGAGENIPVIILPVTDETMTVINSRIDALNIPQTAKDRYKQSLRQVPLPTNSGYIWQQDYMQGFVDPASGQPMIRRAFGYEAGHGLRRELFTPELASGFSECGIMRGPDLIAEGEFRAGNMGGNIEALPGGICVLGNDHFEPHSQWQTYMDRVCRDPSPSARIEAPTDWLKVGHTDEILKTVRNKNKQAPCDFSVVLASPRKAIELLQQNPNEPFLDFTGGRGGTPTELAQRRVLAYDGLSQLCFQINSPPETESTPRRGVPAPSPSPAPAPGNVMNIREQQNSNGSVLNYGLQVLLFGQIAYAEVPVDTENFCAGMTNGQVAAVLAGDNDLGRYNRLVQQQMDNLREEIRNKIQQRIPNCQPDFIEAPDAFFGGAPVRKADGTYELPKGQALSILPNPTNAISINDTIISPEPGNRAFKNYLSEQYSRRGLSPQYVDTFDTTHQGMGNLHCSTNTVHLCSPRGVQ
jgi:hypothetical protein